MNIETSKDSTRTTFSITKKEYEDPQKRKKVLEDYKNNPNYPIPRFSIDYFTTNKPRRISSISNICTLIVTLEDFRQNYLKYSKELGVHRVIFLKKIADNKFVEWNTFIAIEL